MHSEVSSVLGLCHMTLLLECNSQSAKYAQLVTYCVHTGLCSGKSYLGGRGGGVQPMPMDNVEQAIV
jgi:hypothetical protein